MKVSQDIKHAENCCSLFVYARTTKRGVFSHYLVVLKQTPSLHCLMSRCMIETPSFLIGEALFTASPVTPAAIYSCVGATP